MNYEKLAAIQEQYSYCEECKVHHSIGQGRVDAIGLLIVPKPISNNKEYPATYDNSSSEFKILCSIFNKVKLDIDDWYITPTVGCDKYCNKDGVLKANERLKKIIHFISPKIIVLSGAQSFYAFFGKVNKEKNIYKEIICDKYKVVYTKDLSEYLISKTSEDSNTAKYAEDIFNTWKTVKEML